MINRTETIAAIATAAGNSGIGIVRISGDEAFEVLNRIFIPAKEKDMLAVPTHTIHYGNIADGGQVIDEVLVMIMRAPRTYTREDTVEINCHGGVYVQGKVLELVIKNGARLAQPGEFTRRAFENGRIDLSQAEAVTDVINAENNYALKSAVSQLKGSVSEKIRREREILLEQTAYIEAALDDPEHIEMEGYGEVLLPVLEDIEKEVEHLIEGADDGRILKEGIRTVILGKPNVGKSSLLNALLGQERAIVTDIAGTTRDTLEEHIRLGNLALNVVDTAGIRETDDVIEKIGVDKALASAEDADLIIFVTDSSAPLDGDDLEILERIRNKKIIVLLNKQDLGAKTDVSEIKKYLDCPVIETALTQGKGLDELSGCIETMFLKKEIDFNDQVYITNARQKNALTEAKLSLDRAMESIRAGMSEDFFTIDMMDAYEYLGQITGETVEDDLADEIFSKFCMGK